DGVAAARRQRLVWGRYHGDERRCFVQCAELVDSLSASAALALGGAEAQLWVRRVKDAQRALGEDVPESLVSAPVQLINIRSNRVQLAGYSSMDPIRIPRQVFEVLGRFDGRPTAEVMADLWNAGIELEPAFVRRVGGLRGFSGAMDRLGSALLPLSTPL